jgi:hypothetical protein
MLTSFGMTKSETTGWLLKPQLLLLILFFYKISVYL